MQLQLTQETTEIDGGWLKKSAIVRCIHPTATIWVSPGRYTYEASDNKHNGHCGEVDEPYLHQAIKLQAHLLICLGYTVIIQNTTIEG